MNNNNKKFLMGNEAIAWGAINAGVQIATGYPGTPSTEVLEAIAKQADKFGIYAEWSTNEKVALETAAGAAYAGARAIVTMKQVGLNVASDPLMSLAYIGVKGALVIVVADDPGPHSSQTEQDTRVFGHFANIPVLDPSSPQEAYDMTKWAFELSHEMEIPVILRTTTRISHGCSDVIVDNTDPPAHNIEGFKKDKRWAIFPKLTAQRHPWLEDVQLKLSDTFSSSRFNIVSINGPIGIVTSGISYHYAIEAIGENKDKFSIFKLGGVYPFPEKAVVDFLRKVRCVIVIEELDPYLEEQILEITGKYHLPLDVFGKKNGFFPKSGEYNVDIVTEGINKILKYLKSSWFLPQNPHQRGIEILPSLPTRQPTLCAGCMHRTAFYAFKKATEGMRAVFSGDIGCYTLGNADPLNMVDTCLCMGAGISIAAGLQRVQREVKHIAFIGDSTFFHSGIPALINAVYNNADITVVVLDNRTTAMTGHQPHPGMGKTATGKNSKIIDIVQIVKSCGVEWVKTVDTDNLEKCINAAREALNFTGPSVVVFRGPCVNITKSTRQYTIKAELCTGCNYCVKQLGCPAIFPLDKPVIQDTCTGCGLCAQICPANAIGIREEKV